MSALTEYLSAENERSLYSLSPPGLQRGLSRVNEDVFQMSEEELETKIKPTSVLHSLRYRLWTEFSKSVDLGNKLKTEDICAGITTPAYFNQRVCRNPLIVAWLAHPPRSYEDAAEEALRFGIKKMREVLEHSLVDLKGKLHVSTARLQLDIVKMLDARARGAPVQVHKHDVRSRSLSISAEVVNSPMEAIENMNMEDLEKRLRKLRKDEEKHVLIEEERPGLKQFKSRGVQVEDEAEIVVKEEKEF